MSVRIRLLRQADLPDVFAIEQNVFPDDSWTDAMFASELAQRKTRHYIVAEEDGLIVGYKGLSVVSEHQEEIGRASCRERV